MSSTQREVQKTKANKTYYHISGSPGLLQKIHNLDWDYISETTLYWKKSKHGAHLTHLISAHPKLA